MGQITGAIPAIFNGEPTHKPYVGQVAFCRFCRERLELDNIHETFHCDKETNDYYCSVTCWTREFERGECA